MAKVVNICLYGPVTDDWTYQDNLLPKYQKINGNEVTVITSKWVYDEDGNLVLFDKTDYFNKDGVKIVRLNIKGNKPLSYKFKIFEDLYTAITREEPDILFVHNCQFLDVYEIVRYVKAHKNVQVFVDNHCDYSNSAKTWISKNILHKIIWKRTAKAIEPYATAFYGVIPARVDFLNELYKIDPNKTKLLVMGVDDQKAEKIRNEDVTKKLRSGLGIQENDFVIITGGKIDLAKQQIFSLIDAVKRLSERFSVKLVIFGPVVEEMKDKFIGTISGNKDIIYLGWVNADESMRLLINADLAIYPGRHSVYWEETVGLGIPIIVKYWEGTTHVDVGGNAEFLYNETPEEIVNIVSSLIEKPEKYIQMKKVAQTKGRDIFSYRNIAKRSIDSNLGG